MEQVRTEQVEIRIYTKSGKYLATVIWEAENRGYGILPNLHYPGLGSIEKFFAERDFSNTEDGIYGYQIYAVRDGAEWMYRTAKVTVKKGKVATGRVPSGIGNSKCWGKMVSYSVWKFINP